MAGFNTISLKLKEMYQVCVMIVLSLPPPPPLLCEHVHSTFVCMCSFLALKPHFRYSSEHNLLNEIRDLMQKKRILNTHQWQ